MPKTEVMKKPWGTHQVLFEEKGVKIKKLVIEKGQGISLQYHKHRDELWKIVKGTGTYTSHEGVTELKEIQVAKGSVIKIDKRRVHRIKNVGNTKLEVIEIQTGNVLKESDIVRISDVYGRK